MEDSLRSPIRFAECVRLCSKRLRKAPLITSVTLGPTSAICQPQVWMAMDSGHRGMQRVNADCHLTLIFGAYHCPAARKLVEDLEFPESRKQQNQRAKDEEEQEPKDD